MAYHYKCVAGPTHVEVYGKESMETAVKTFEDIMNDQAKDGWEYVGVDEITSVQKPGCLAFWSPPETSIMKMLVFKRPA